MRPHRASHLMLWLACFAWIGVRGAAAQVCGDGTQDVSAWATAEALEQCDDGNTVSGDEQRSMCRRLWAAVRVGARIL